MYMVGCITSKKVDRQTPYPWNAPLCSQGSDQAKGALEGGRPGQDLNVQIRLTSPKYTGN
jgi:hypothetical protein